MSKDPSRGRGIAHPNFPEEVKFLLVRNVMKHQTHMKPATCIVNASHAQLFSLRILTRAKFLSQEKAKTKGTCERSGWSSRADRSAAGRGRGVLLGTTSSSLSKQLPPPKHFVPATLRNPEASFYKSGKTLRRHFLVHIMN